ncbi:hypothetical protein F5883DRAFT_547249 [Diaporthe sp. PMI_573]|nr:hypothetical protein F5883DRAFT_547249 [Diaporthaceae sp. PMI_573]
MPLFPWLLSCTWRLGHYHIVAINYCSNLHGPGRCGMGDRLGLNWMGWTGWTGRRGGGTREKIFPALGVALAPIATGHGGCMSRTHTHTQLGFRGVSRMNLWLSGVVCEHAVIKMFI